MMTSSHTTPRCGEGKRQLKQNCTLFGVKTYLQVIDVVYFVKNHKLDVANKISSTIKHTSQNLGRHNQTACLRFDLDVTSQDTDIIAIRFLEISKLLVTERLDW
jgi:hypothetical protein